MGKKNKETWRIRESTKKGKKSEGHKGMKWPKKKRWLQTKLKMLPKENKILVEEGKRYLDRIKQAK